MTNQIPSAVIRGVLGDVTIGERTGVALVHEHLSCDLSATSGPTYVLQDLSLLVGEVRAAADSGVRLIIDVGNSGHHRDVGFLAGIAGRSGVLIVASTGHYRQGFYPEVVESATVETLADLMVADIEEGIEGQEVRAGAIAEIGTSGELPTASEEKVMLAAGLAQARTNAPLLTHTTEGTGWKRQIELLRTAGADFGKVVIGHMDCVDDHRAHVGVIESGAWLGFDRINSARYQSDEVRCCRLKELVDEGYGDRVVLSHDIATTSRLTSEGAPGYAGVVRDFVPRLRRAGVEERSIEQLWANAWSFVLK